VKLPIGTRARFVSWRARSITREARHIGLEALTLYAFSAQNWARPPDEVAAPMQLLAEFLDSERAEIMENAIRLDAIGDLDRLPGFVRDRLDRLPSRLRIERWHDAHPGALLRRPRGDSAGSASRGGLVRPRLPRRGDRG
jgi:hypothetical protein